MSTHSPLMHARHGAVLHGATRSPWWPVPRCAAHAVLLGGVAGVLLGLPVSLMPSRRRTLRQTWAAHQRWLDDALARNQSSALPLRMK